jgi:tRNA modification GTPase
VFSQRVHGLRDALIHLRMLVEATLDFPEEEIDFLQKADAAGQLARLQEQVRAVLAEARQGALLREGLTVVIAGQPNAGKSSLINALAGAELAIVTPIAGTTRDVVQQTIQIEGVPLHVVDTAGLREGTDVDEVERIGIERAWGQIARADAVLFLHDLTRAHDAAYAAADAAIAAQLQRDMPPGVPVLQVWNKTDQVDAAVLGGVPMDEASLAMSARSGAGLDALRQRLLAMAGWQPAAEGLFMARERHVQALHQVAGHLGTAADCLALQAAHLDVMAEELRLAQQALGAITGEFSADDLLGEIFSRFCIGK